MFVFGTADEVFSMAIRLKENGHAMYAHAAESAQDPVIKKVFEDLAELEQEHIGCFKSVRCRLPEHFPEGTAWDPEGLAQSYLETVADTHVFTQDTALERLPRIHEPVEAVDMAIEFEKESVQFLLGLKHMLPDTEGKDEIDRLIAEEMYHIGMLSRAKKRCFPSSCDILPAEVVT
ncbi:MAG: ferritin family protein [Thermodesulfobacteriota bacterium]